MKVTFFISYEVDLMDKHIEEFIKIINHLIKKKFIKFIDHDAKEPEEEKRTTSFSKCLKRLVKRELGNAL